MKVVILCKGDYYLKNTLCIKLPLNCFSYENEKGCLLHKRNFAKNN